MAMKVEEVTGEMLTAVLRTHPHQMVCPYCNKGVGGKALTGLAYTFDPCDCGHAPYRHLHERIWHLDCLKAAPGSSR